MGHVHGIAENPGDGQVYLATHTGVYRIERGGPTLIANRYQDTMGFTIAGPDEFLASGHPALDEDTPNPLGLIRSTDRAESWESLAFSGEQDFHAIDASSSLIYAYGSDGRLMRSSNLETWTTVLRAPLIDFTLDPRQPDELLATSDSGLLLRIDAKDPQPQELASAPRMAYIDRTMTSEIVGVDGTGRIFMSTDGANSWTQLANVNGAPEALSVRADTWYVATEKGVFSSADEGASWQTLTKATM